MTVAGREGVGGSVTRQISIEEAEQNCPVTLLTDLLPEDFSCHLLQTFASEAKSWGHGKRWLHDKEIVSHRLMSGFHLSEQIGGNLQAISSSSASKGKGKGKGKNRAKEKRAQLWEKTGFIDDIKAVRNFVKCSVRKLRHERNETYNIAVGEDRRNDPVAAATSFLQFVTKGIKNKIKINYNKFNHFSNLEF